MKKRIAIPLLCLCVILLLAGGLALLIASGHSLADAFGVFLEKPFEDASEELSKEFPEDTDLPSDTAEPVPHEHTINESGPCYCGNAYIIRLENGGWEITEYDPERKWNPLLETEYDAAGNTVRVTRYEYEYESPEDMEPKHTLTYENDVLIHEGTRDVYPEVDSDNAYWESITYLEDGSRIVSLYKHEYRDFVFYYDAEGELTKTERFAYTCDAMGRILGEVRYVNDVRTYEYLCFRSPSGVWYWDYEIFCDENGDPEQHYTWEYTYDEWREPNYMVKKLDGAVIEETFFGDAYGYGQYVYRKVTYDAYGQVLTDTYYDPEGNEITP